MSPAAAPRAKTPSPSRDPRRGHPAPQPSFVAPCHPSEREVPPAGPDWIHEIKLDGYRAQVHLHAGAARVFTRTGLDWTEPFARIARAAEALPLRAAILDGEAIVEDRKGVADFHALRRTLRTSDPERLIYYAFDLIYLDGRDLRALPLIERKRLLRDLLPPDGRTLVFAEYFDLEGEAVFRQACRMNLEGIVSKRRDAPYRSGRVETWIKVKCKKSGTYPIVAFVEKLGARPRRIASLYVGRQEGGKLLYTGKVATGFTEAAARELRERLDPLILKHSPLSVPVKKPKATWVRPELPAEVEYSAITEDGLLRAAVFKGVRDDLAPAPPPANTKPARPHIGVPRENILQLLPDAVVPSKEELARYWKRVAARALPYLGRRPLKLVRHTHRTTFYHMGPLPLLPEPVHQMRIEKREGGAGVRLWVDDLDGLIGLVAIGAVELHPWAATIDDIERADALVFDLDPGDGVAWPFVIETALKLRALLAAEGLASWPKTSGGKGLHVMAPLAERLAHDDAHALARRFAERLAATDPDRYVTAAARAQRPGRLFIDYLRNGRGTTAIGAYSPRARPGFPVAAPVTWQQVEHGIGPDAFTIEHPPTGRHAPRSRGARR